MNAAGDLLSDSQRVTSLRAISGVLSVFHRRLRCVVRRSGASAGIANRSRPETDRSAAEKRLVATDGHPVTIASLREIIPQRMMLRAAIVPEGNRARLPLEAAHELRRLDVPVQHLKQRSALLLLQLRNVSGEAAVDVKRFPSGHGMR